MPFDGLPPFASPLTCACLGLGPASQVQFDEAIPRFFPFVGRHCRCNIGQILLPFLPGGLPLANGRSSLVPGPSLLGCYAGAVLTFLAVPALTGSLFPLSLTH